MMPEGQVCPSAENTLQTTDGAHLYQNLGPNLYGSDGHSYGDQRVQVHPNHH